MTQETARLLFAAFPPGLKSAMKTAATRNAWCAETWPLQIALIQVALAAGYDPVTLATAYEDLGEALVRIERFISNL